MKEHRSLYIDDSCFPISPKAGLHSQVKHVALRFFCIQELVKEGKISIHYVQKEDKTADTNTKYLSKHMLRFEKCC